MESEPRVVVGDIPTDAWLEASRLLLASGNRFNLTLHVREPLVFNQGQLDRLDPARFVHNARPLRDVATTIFPAKSARWNLSVTDFTNHYKDAYERLLARGQRMWGCYFLRLVAFGPTDINQLERVVTGLSTWGAGHKAAFVVHFSASTLDLPRPLGAPCLQYVQFMVNAENRLCLSAVYRSHDYFHKTLGNLVGLSRLLEYAALKSRHEIGTLSCLSTYAFIDVSRRKARAMLDAV